MAEKKQHPSEQSGSGQLDYGANQPTGGTNANTGKINPQAPTSGTENSHPDRQKGQQSTADSDSPLDDDRNAQIWTSREIPLSRSAAGEYQDVGASPNAGDIQSMSGNLDPGASASPGAGAGDPGNHQSFRCSDSGNADCRWETSSASANDLWADIERHHREAHGKPTLDEISRGHIQDAIHVRRAA
jgi:predicted small metal-binding protein